MSCITGNYIGKFVESDENNFVGVWREYLCVRVTIDLTKPLKRRMKLRNSQENWCWVNFRYKGILTFCFICGMIGHGEKFCDKIFEVPIEQIEKPYGAWMKAEPRRRIHIMGAKWPRQGGKNPVVFSVKQTEDEGRKVDTRKDSIKGKNPENSSNRMDMAITSQQIVLGDNIVESVVIGENISQTNVNNVRITEESISLNKESGLHIVDPKRRRIEEPNASGPLCNNNEEEIYTDMTEDLVSKNGLMAGSARQTRQLL